MTGEVTDSFDEITLFGMAIFWQKAIEFFTKFIIHFLIQSRKLIYLGILLLCKKQLNSLQNCYKVHFLAYRVTLNTFNTYLTRNFVAFLFYRSLQIGRDMDCWVTGRYAAKLIGGRELFSFA